MLRHILLRKCYVRFQEFVVLRQKEAVDNGIYIHLNFAPCIVIILIYIFLVCKLY